MDKEGIIRLKEEIKRYCPNDLCANNIVNYIENIILGNEMSDFEKTSFEKSFKDMVVFTSQDILSNVLKESFTKVKNIANLVSVDSNGVLSSDRKTRDNRDKNSMEFDIIDLDIIPKSAEIVNISRINNQVGNEKVTPKLDNDEDDNLDRFSTDASSITEEGFDSEPKFSFDIDY